MTRLKDRQPTEAECFQALASALQRLGGECDNTAAAIQKQMEPGGTNFETAARDIRVSVDDLKEVFAAEMFQLGFVVATAGRMQ